MRWITRENIKVDRVACPWLIKRIVDPDTEFLFVPDAELLSAAARERATPFDVPRLSRSSSEPSRREVRSRGYFEDYNLIDPPLQRLGELSGRPTSRDRTPSHPKGWPASDRRGICLARIDDAERVHLLWPVLLERLERRRGTNRSRLSCLRRRIAIPTVAKRVI